MKINKISRGIGALGLSAFILALPAFATTIESFTTGMAPSAGAASGETNSYFAVVDTSISSFDPTSGQSFGGPIFGSPTDNFGGFIFDKAPPPNGTSSNVTVALTPTINGGQAAVVDFSGAISSAISGCPTQYCVTFSGTAGSTQVNMGTVANPNYYTDLNSGGVNYEIQTTQSLNSGQDGKQTWLAGYIIGVPAALAPEPATFSATALALLLVGFGIRRKAKLTN